MGNIILLETMPYVNVVHKQVVAMSTPRPRQEHRNNFSMGANRGVGSP